LVFPGRRKLEVLYTRICYGALATSIDLGRQILEGAVAFVELSHRKAEKVKEKGDED